MDGALKEGLGTRLDRVGHFFAEVGHFFSCFDSDFTLSPLFLFVLIQFSSIIPTETFAVNKIRHLPRSRYKDIFSIRLPDFIVQSLFLFLV